MLNKVKLWIIGILTCASSLYANDLILQIRNEYNLIQTNLPSYSLETMDLYKYSSDGEILHIARDEKGEIRRLSLDLYGETGKRKYEFYLKEDSLFFAYVEDYEYNVPYYVDSTLALELGSEPFNPEKTTVLEDRYYFHDDSLIKWIDSKSITRVRASEEFEQAEKRILEFCAELLLMANQKR